MLRVFNYTDAAKCWQRSAGRGTSSESSGANPAHGSASPVDSLRPPEGRGSRSETLAAADSIIDQRINQIFNQSEILCVIFLDGLKLDSVTLTRWMLSKNPPISLKRKRNMLPRLSDS